MGAIIVNYAGILYIQRTFEESLNKAVYVQINVHHLSCSLGLEMLEMAPSIIYRLRMRMATGENIESIESPLRPLSLNTSVGGSGLQNLCSKMLLASHIASMKSQGAAIYFQPR
jgi:hypothetical protein